MAGSDYSLFCEVTISPFSDTTAVSESFVTWTRPSGETQHKVGKSIQLVFSPLTIDNEGVYTCTAYYFLNEIKSPEGSDNYEVSISKSLCF